MIAIFKHELRSAWNSLTYFLFCGALLCVVGVGSVLYNIQAAVSNFEYALNYVSIALVIVIPVLTMRSFAEERKQKTDQLLYSLPLKTWEIVLGKFFALAGMFLLPMLLICLYPLLFSLYGEVYLPGAYGSIFAFYLMGAALIALGMFLSSLTENLGFAAGISIVVFLCNYYSVTFAEQVSSTGYGSLLALCAAGALAGILVKVLTKSLYLALGVGGGLVALTMGVYCLIPDAFQGLFPAIMRKLSLFSRFSTFVGGVFDMTNVVFYITVIMFGLFLTVQSLEKRRYN